MKDVRPPRDSPLEQRQRLALVRLRRAIDGNLEALPCDQARMDLLCRLQADIELRQDTLRRRKTDLGSGIEAARLRRLAQVLAK